MKLIAAVDSRGAIGRGDGSLLFHIPDDMARFRELTMGETVIMGRKTFESLPGGRPLAGRRNIVLTRNEDYSCEGAEICHSVSELRELCGSIPGENIVIGGGDIYRLLMPLCTAAYITRIDADGGGDVFMPPFGELWRLVKRSELREHEGISYRFEEYKRSAVCPSCLMRGGGAIQRLPSPY